MIDFKNTVLVVAHPDDEILWFSSILENVSKIIIIFKGTDNKRVLFGRNNILNSKILPYTNKITCLEIEESNVLNNSNQKMPKPTIYGMKTSSIKYHVHLTKLSIIRSKIIQFLELIISNYFFKLLVKIKNKK